MALEEEARSMIYYDFVPSYDPFLPLHHVMGQTCDIILSIAQLVNGGYTWFTSPTNPEVLNQAERQIP